MTCRKEKGNVWPIRNKTGKRRRGNESRREDGKGKRENGKGMEIRVLNMKV